MADQTGSVPQIQQVAWSRTPTPEDEVVLLLHGLGADENDLISLSEALPSGVVYASLRGIFRYQDGWAWLDNPIRPDRSDRLCASVAATAQWVTANGQPVAGIIGFSQGGILALELLRTQPEAFAFVAALASGPFPAHNRGDAQLAKRRPPVLWGYGDQDPHLTPDVRTFTRQWLDEHVDLTEICSPGLGHDINEHLVGKVADFILQVIPW